MKRKIRYFESFHEENVIQTKEVHLDLPVKALQLKQLIGIKGAIPRVGDQVKLRKHQSKERLRGEVLKVSPDGVPIKVRLDDGKVIEVVGYLLQLINLIDVILDALKELFSKSKEGEPSITYSLT